MEVVPHLVIKNTVGVAEFSLSQWCIPRAQDSGNVSYRPAASPLIRRLRPTARAIRRQSVALAHCFVPPQALCSSCPSPDTGIGALPQIAVGVVMIATIDPGLCAVGCPGSRSVHRIADAAAAAVWPEL